MPYGIEVIVTNVDTKKIVLHGDGMAWAGEGIGPVLKSMVEGIISGEVDLVEDGVVADPWEGDLHVVWGDS